MKNHFILILGKESNFHGDEFLLIHCQITELDYGRLLHIRMT
jgi:hypothetical protein